MSIDNKYFPLNEVQFKELKEKIDSVNMHLPDNMLNYVWNNFQLISGSIEPTPCGCASAAGHWIRAITTLRNWIKEMEKNDI